MSLAGDLRNKIRVLCAHAWLEPRCSNRYLLSRANTGATLRDSRKLLSGCPGQKDNDINHGDVEGEKVVDDGFNCVDQSK